MRRFLTILLLLPGIAVAASAGYRLEHSPHDLRDLVSLQAGARTYVNYCVGCHSLQYVRYSSLSDIGLSEALVKEHLLFTADKVGEPIKGPLDARAAKVWFGVAPPDLSVIARVRGADWLYTYLRTFYRDPKTTTGWNNPVYPNVAMPHVLWTLQGERKLEVVAHGDSAGHAAVEYKWSDLSKGTQSPTEYDATVRDLVNFLVYVGEPAAADRKSIGIVVLFVLLGVLLPLTMWLKKEFWKDVK